MNRKQRFGFVTSRSVRSAGRATKNAAKDAAKGASLLGRFARGTVVGAVRSTKNAVADVRQGARYGWAAAVEPEDTQS